MKSAKVVSNLVKCWLVAAACSANRSGSSNRAAVSMRWRTRCRNSGSSPKAWRKRVWSAALRVMGSFHGPSSIPRRRRVCLWHLPPCQGHDRGAAAMLAAVALDSHGPVPAEASQSPSTGPRRTGIRRPLALVRQRWAGAAPHTTDHALWRKAPVLPATGVELAFDTGRANPDSAKTHRPLQDLHQSGRRVDYTAHPLQIYRIDPNSGAPNPDWGDGRNSCSLAVTAVQGLYVQQPTTSGFLDCIAPPILSRHWAPVGSPYISVIMATPNRHGLTGCLAPSPLPPMHGGSWRNQRQAVHQSSAGLLRRNESRSLPGGDDPSRGTRHDRSLPVLADRITT